MSKIEHIDKSTIVSDFSIFLILNNLAILSHTVQVKYDVHLNFIVEKVTNLFSKHVSTCTVATVDWWRKISYMIHNHTFGQKVILMRQMNSFLERFSHSFPLAKQIQEFAQNSKNAKNAKIIVLDYSEVTVSQKECENSSY